MGRNNNATSFFKRRRKRQDRTPSGHVNIDQEFGAPFVFELHTHRECPCTALNVGNPQGLDTFKEMSENVRTSKMSQKPHSVIPTNRTNLVFRITRRETKTLYVYFSRKFMRSSYPMRAEIYYMCRENSMKPGTEFNRADAGAEFDEKQFEPRARL